MERKNKKKQLKIIRKVNSKKDFINQIKNKDIKVKNYMDVKTISNR